MKKKEYKQPQTNSALFSGSLPICSNTSTLPSGGSGGPAHAKDNYPYYEQPWDEF